MRIRAIAIALLIMLAASLSIPVNGVGARQATPTPTSGAIKTVCAPDELFPDAPRAPVGLDTVSRCGTWNTDTKLYLYQGHYTIDKDVTLSMTTSDGILVESLTIWGTTLITVSSGSLTITIDPTCPVDFANCGAIKTSVNTSGAVVATAWDRTSSPITLQPGDSIQMYNVKAMITSGSNGADIVVVSTFEKIGGACSGPCYHM